MHGQDQPVYAFHQTVGKLCAHCGQSLLEVGQIAAAFFMLVDHELGEGLVVDSQMVLQFRGDLGNQGKELEGSEVVHGQGKATSGTVLQLGDLKRCSL